MAGIPFPYKNPHDGQMSAFNVIGSQKQADAMFHLAEILIENHYVTVEIRLNQTLFMYCLERAARKLPVHPPNHVRGAGASGGTAELPHVDGMFIVGSYVAAAISRMRPLQFVSEPSPNDTVLLHINDVFALEYGWLVSLWLVRHHDIPGYPGTSKKIFDDLSWDLLAFRSWWEKAQSMFQYLSLENPDPLPLAIFYNSLPHHVMESSP
ncbi:MAG: hypothetical protein H7833_03255 [Magnetococcus sp. DMHC-1]